MADIPLPTEYLGLAIHVMDGLPAGAFMLVSRLDGEPVHFNVILSENGVLKSWVGTLTEANNQSGQKYMPDTTR